MNYPKVSVIIPTYNRANLLPRAIKSVLNQTFQDFELIIVDDGSTDNTRKVVEEFQRKDQRIKYIFQENSGGPAKPINTGIKNSKGEYIAILESDDEWLPEKLEKQVEILDKFPNVGLVSCYAFKIFSNGKKTIYKAPFSGILKKEDWKKYWQLWGILSFSTDLMKRKSVEKVGLLDENLKIAADVDFYLRFIKQFDFYFIPIPLINYYQIEESQSRKEFWIRWIPEYHYLLEKHEKDFEICKKGKSKFLRHLGTCYILKREFLKARKYFFEAILNDPFNIRLYFQFLLSFFPRVYQKILFIKRDNF